MDGLVPTSMNVKHKGMNLTQVTTATVTPIVLILREVLPVNVYMATQVMGSPVGVRSTLQIIDIFRNILNHKHLYIIFFLPDIDECFTSTPCHNKANCVNTKGSYNCECKEGKIIFLYPSIISEFQAFFPQSSLILTGGMALNLIEIKKTMCQRFHLATIASNEL